MCTELAQNCNSTNNLSSYFGLIDARMSASDKYKDSPVRLKTGFDPITYTPFSRKRKNKKRKIARVFVAQFAHFGLKKVRAVGMSKN